MKQTELKNVPLLANVDEKFLASIKLVSFSNDGEDALFTTFNDEVYAIGGNDCGQHGVGDKAPSIEPKRVNALCYKKIVAFRFGWTHALAISKDGKLFSWGENHHGQLGNNSTNENLIPTLVESLKGKRVNSIACGSYHCLVLTEDGDVFAFGSNDFGQIVGTRNNALVPKKVDFELPSKHSCPVQVACGSEFSMMLLNTGEIFSWGRNSFGLLGLGHEEERSTPCHVKALEGNAITKIACGNGFALALSKSGHIFSWGYNDYGQLGNGNFELSSLPMRIAEEVGPFIDIAAYSMSNISAAISQSTKNCYIWGETKEGKVSRPKRTECMSIPEAFLSHSKDSIYPGEIAFSKNDVYSLKAQFKRAFNNKEMSNVTFIVDGQELHAFKEVLMIGCEHFRTMFNERWQDTTNDQPILIDQVSYPVYKALLYYLYTDEVELESVEEIIELMDLAHSYLEPGLKEKCEWLLIEAIDVDTAALLCAVALKYEAATLEQFSLRFFVKNMADIVKTEAFANLDAEVAKTLFKRIPSAGAIF